MKKIASFFILIIILLSSVISPVKLVLAEEDQVCADIDDVTKKSTCLNDLIAKYQKQLSDAKGQEKTLKSQLTYIDTQNKITELKEAAAKNQIAKLDQEIKDLSTRITRLSATLDDLSQVLLNRIVQTYKYGNYSAIDLFFSSNGFADLLGKVKYIQVAQANDKKVLYQLQATKITYNDQKVDKQSRQAEQEKLKKDLEKYQIQLADQQKNKAELLRITQNDEATYQSKIRAAQQEQNAILAILRGQGSEVAVGPVSKGAMVGSMLSGRSACSTGTHLHFEVHQNGQIVNPSTLLSNTNVTWDNSPDGSFALTGSWDWPVTDPIISQGYGMTSYAQGKLTAGILPYNGGPHTGIDMYTSSGLGVKAVKDGTLSRGGIACGSGTLYYKKIDQGDGITTYYLHVL